MAISTFETEVPRQKLIWCWSLTAATWLFVYSDLIPGLNRMPAFWAALVAALFVLVLWIGPARHYLRSLLLWSKDPYKLPQRMIAIAALLAFFYSLIKWSLWFQTSDGNSVAKLHFHTSSFLLCLDLMSRRFMASIWKQTGIEGLEKQGLTRAMAQRIHEAQQEQNPFLKKTLGWMPPFYIAIGIVSVFTLTAWFLFEGILGNGFIQVAAILVIASPWAFLFSAPHTFRISLRTAAYRNVLLSGATILELATHLNALIFGKSGTLTQGLPRVTDIIPMTNIDEEELLLWAASAEHDSKHPFGQAIVAEASSQSIPLEPPERFIELSGRGVECVIDGQAVRLGKPTFFKESEIPAYLADRLTTLAQEGKTAFICCRGDQCLGIIAVTEELRHEAAEVIEKIRKLGLQVILLTGDDRMMAESLAEKLHIDRVIAEVLPNNKTQEINKLRREGFQVGMVGNFSEDADCLAESDLGITLTRGRGTELPPTDVILIENNLKNVVTFLRIGHRTLRTAHENHALSIIYHIVAILLAAGCLVPFGFAAFSPITASLCSAGWLLLVSLNNHRIADFR